MSEEVGSLACPECGFAIRASGSTGSSVRCPKCATLVKVSPSRPRPPTRKSVEANKSPQVSSISRTPPPRKSVEANKSPQGDDTAAGEQVVSSESQPFPAVDTSVMPPVSRVPYVARKHKQKREIAKLKWTCGLVTVCVLIGAVMTSQEDGKGSRRRNGAGRSSSDENGEHSTGENERANGLRSSSPLPGRSNAYRAGYARGQELAAGLAAAWSQAPNFAVRSSAQETYDYMLTLYLNVRNARGEEDSSVQNLKGQCDGLRDSLLEVGLVVGY